MIFDNNSSTKYSACLLLFILERMDKNVQKSSSSIFMVTDVIGLDM